MLQYRLSERARTARPDIPGKAVSSMTFLRGAVADFLRRADLVLLALCVAANTYGIVLIYSASRYWTRIHSYPLKQALAMVLGIACFILCTYIDVEVLMEKWKWLLAGSVLFILLLKTPLVDEAAAATSGNTNWLSIPGIPFSIQPAEIVKLVFVMMVAKQLVWLREQRSGISAPSSVVQLLAHFGFMGGLILVISGDMGMVTIYAGIFVIMMWAGGVSKKWFAAGLAMAGTLTVILWNFVLPNTKYWTDYRIMRFRVLLDHNLDPLDVGWHQTRSLLALGSGRLTGMGFLNGTQTQSASKGSLPERYTDFIFSSCGEELGMLGCLLILALLTAIILRCFYVGLRAPSSLTALVCVGYGGMLLVQTALNVGMCLYVAPVIGITLPFFSYGGSSLLTMYVAMGIVSGIRGRALPSWLQDRAMR